MLSPTTSRSGHSKPSTDDHQPDDGQTQERERVRRLSQLAANRLPHPSFQILTNSGRRKLIVPALTNRFGVCAAQNIGNVIQAKSKSVFFVNAVDARQKFLRRQCPIERLARGQTIIAAVAWRGEFFAEIF